MATFTWGPGGSRMTPEDIATQRKFAQSLLASGMDYSPIASPWQGAARVAQALLGGYQSGEADFASRQNATESNDMLAKAVASINGGGAAIPASTPAVATAPTAPSASTPGADLIRAGLIERGIPEPVADGFLMNFRDESGLNPAINEAKPLVPGSRGGFGLAQWTGPRRVALEQFAANAGRPVDDVNTQLDFLVSELQGPEAKAAQSFMGAQTPQDAAVAIAKNFLRPAPENLQRRVAQYSGGMAQAAPAAQVASRGINPAILELVTSPYVSDSAKKIGSLLFQQQLQQQDPMRQLQMQKIQADLAAGKNPESVREYEYARTNGFGGSFQDWIASKRAGAGEYSLTPVYGKDAQGNTVLIQPGKTGTAIQTKLPEGVTISSGVEKVDLGTQWGIMDKRSGQIIGYQPKDLKGAESQKALGKAQGGMQATLPSDIQNAETTVTQIDDLIKHPGLSSIVGPIDQFRPGWTMGAEGRDALARYNQLKGKAFLQAYTTLRGGGQITEVEGTKAENAMARMDRAQSEAEFTTALRDFRDAVMIGMKKLREKAGVAEPFSQPSGGKRLRFNPATGTLE